MTKFTVRIELHDTDDYEPLQEMERRGFLRTIEANDGSVYRLRQGNITRSATELVWRSEPLRPLQSGLLGRRGRFSSPPRAVVIGGGWTRSSTTRRTIDVRRWAIRRWAGQSAHDDRGPGEATPSFHPAVPSDRDWLKGLAGGR